MAKAVTIYGIKNCDTMKKARAWLDKRGVTYEFHDYKSAGIERSMLERWARQAGLGGAHQSRRPHVPRVAGAGPGRAHREEGDRADDRAAVDDQAAGARRRRQAPRGLQAGAVREGIRRAALTSSSCAFRPSPPVRSDGLQSQRLAFLGKPGRCSRTMQKR